MRYGNVACVPLVVIGSDKCTGTIPEELANLGNLDQLCLADNDFTGKDDNLCLFD